MEGFAPLLQHAEDGFQEWDLGGGDGDGFEAIGPWGRPSEEAVRPGPVPVEDEPSPEVVSAVFPAVVAPDPAPDPAELEELRRAAYEEAYAEGLADGKRKALELAGEVEDLLLQLQGLRAEFFNRSVRDVASTITEIANSVVRRELSFDSSGVENLVVSVLEDTVQGDEVVIRLAPEDDRAMKEAYPRLLEVLGRDGAFRIELDGSMHPGGAVIDTSYGSIDAAVETQLAAFAEGIQVWADGEVDLGDE